MGQQNPKPGDIIQTQDGKTFTVTDADEYHNSDSDVVTVAEQDDPVNVKDIT